MTKLDLKRLEAIILGHTGVPITLEPTRDPDGTVTVRGTFAQPVELATDHGPDDDGLVRMPCAGGVLTLRPLPEE